MATAPQNRIRKITVKTVTGGVDFEEVMKVKKLDLMSVFGVARNMRPGASDLGQYVAFLGDFRAINVKTGEEFASAKMILPKIAEEVLAGVIPAEGGEVKFAMVLGATYDPKAATKYVFTFRPLIESADQNVIEELRGLTIKALPKPGK